MLVTAGAHVPVASRKMHTMTSPLLAKIKKLLTGKPGK
jgi:hypothetical protein